MSISRRLALSLGGIVTVLVICLGALNWWIASSSLLDAVDARLAEQAEAIEDFSSQRRDRAADFGGGFDPGDSIFEQRTFRVQFISPDGSTTGDLDIPLDEEVFTKVSETQTNSFRTEEIGGHAFRIVTHAEDDEIIQIATDITSIQDGLGDLRRGSLVLGIAGVAVAGFLGWIVARRFTKPIVEVTAAASQLAKDHRLPGPIESDRTDEIGQLASSFNELLSALEVSREQQTRLVSDASHELQTPLTSLRLKLEFLQSEPELSDDEQGSIIRGATLEVEALGALVSELVEVASNGMTDETPERLNLGEIADEAARKARLTTRRVVTTSTAGVVVMARPTMVRRALSNLIANANKYSPDGTPIEIHEFGGGIEVRDHGPGTTSEERAHAFNRFYRARGNQHIPGSGIGLAIVKQVADAHGGRVWIDNASGGGAVVGFSVAFDDRQTG